MVSFYEPKYWQQFGMVSTQDSTLVQVTIPRPEGTPAIPCNIRWKEHTYLFGDTIKIEMDAYQTAQIQGNNGMMLYIYRSSIRQPGLMFSLVYLF